MTIEGFTPVSALIGGALIGLAATVLLAGHGRVAGISGILGGLIPPGVGDIGWRIAFLLGLVLGITAYRLADPASMIRIEAGWPVLIVGGVLVGFGTQMGGGCTSGHGVCGLARLSLRSFVATITFMVSAALIVFVVRHAIGT